MKTFIMTKHTCLKILKKTKKNKTADIICFPFEYLQNKAHEVNRECHDVHITWDFVGKKQEWVIFF